MKLPFRIFNFGRDKAIAREFHKLIQETWIDVATRATQAGRAQDMILLKDQIGQDIVRNAMDRISTKHGISHEKLRQITDKYRSDEQ